MPPATPDPFGLATRPRGRGELVLVVDDEEGIRDSLALTLESQGYRAITARDGGEAVTLYARRGAEIAVVLSDMMMPVMGGLGLVRALRTIDPQIKFIAMSGVEIGAQEAKAADAEILHFIPKPCSAEIMLQTLSRVLRGE